MDSSNPKVVVIGGGPAGITCAMQLMRYHIDCCLIEKRFTGGLLVNAGNVENYPGFPGGIQGTHLADLFRKHLETSQVSVHYDEVTKLEYRDLKFIITGNRNTYLADIVVVATGTKPVKKYYFGKMVSEKVFYEYYPLSDIKEMDIAVIGAGDAAFDYALSLAANKNHIKIYNRTGKIKAIPVLANRVNAEKLIEYCPNFIVKNIKTTLKGKKLLINFQNNKPSALADYLIFATGRIAEISFMTGMPGIHEKTAMENNRLFFIGDVKNGNQRQVAIAVGDGMKCAMEIAGLVRGD